MFYNVINYLFEHPIEAFSILAGLAIFNLILITGITTVRKFFKEKQQFYPTILLLSGTLLCLGLIAFRCWYTGSGTFVFLIWNLFLAWIPFFLSLWILPVYRGTRNLILPLLFLGGWLLFLPNAPYIVTDLVHIRLDLNMSVWFDLVLIFSFAWTGLMLGYFSLLEVHRFILNLFHPVFTWVIMFCLLALCSFGVYLGRFVRFNSWDVFQEPLEIFSVAFNYILDPRAMGITLLLFCMLSFGYLTIFLLLREVKARGVA